jgi:iron complex outermembrane recepter protein
MSIIGLSSPQYAGTPAMKYLVLCTCLLISAAPAQEPVRERMKDADRDTLVYIDEVVVTATRTPTLLIEVPLAISVVDQKTVSTARGYGLDEVLGGVPGVLTQSRFGNQDVRLTIRGFGARGAGERSNAGTSRGVRVLSDGIPETEPDGRTSFDLVDLTGAGRIEVIRSNASAVWGNASGGVLNIRSNTFFEQPYSSVQSFFGSYGFRKYAVQAGAMLGDGKFYFSLSNTTFDGWREHSASTQTLMTSGLVAPVSAATTLGVHLAATSNLFRIPGPLTQVQFDTNPRQAQSDTADYKPTYLERDERRFNRLGRLGVTVQHSFDNANTISAMAFVNPKYLQRSERNTFRDFTRYHVGGNLMFHTRTDVSPSVTSMFLAGVDEAYQDGAILFYSLENGQRGSRLLSDKREGANNLGGFFQEELMLGPSVSVIAGGRYDAVTYYAEDYLQPGFTDQKTFSRFTPKAGVTYRFSSFHSVYANLGGGVEVPAGNETDPPSTYGQDTVRALNPLLEPITSTSIEVGTKQLLEPEAFIRTMAYDIAAYWIETRNDIIPYRGGRFYFTAGKTRRWGLEGAAQVQFDHGLSVRAALTLSTSEYMQYSIDSVHYGRPGAVVDLSGNAMAGLPDIFWNLRVRYEPEYLRGVFGQGTLHTVGRYYADDGNILRVPSYTTLDVTLGCEGLTLDGDRLTLSALLTVNNVTDTRYVASAFINPDIGRTSGLPVFLEPGLPRSMVASVTLGLKF